MSIYLLFVYAVRLSSFLPLLSVATLRQTWLLSSSSRFYTGSGTARSKLKVVGSREKVGILIDQSGQLASTDNDE